MYECMYVWELVHHHDGLYALGKRQGELGKLDIVRSYLLDDNLGLGSKYVAVEGKPLKIPADCHHIKHTFKKPNIKYVN